MFSVNIAKNKGTAQSSTFSIYASNLAVDGNKNTLMDSGSCTHTEDNPLPWWRVDLGAQYMIGTVKITNRHLAWDRLSNFDVKIGSTLSSYSL